MIVCSAKEAFNRFKPESCVLVISVDASGRPSGMVAGWNMKCSWEPPLFAVALSKSGYTHRLIRESKEFVIAVPNKGLQPVVEFFGSTHGNEVDKFAATGVATTPARHIRSPLITDATINMECVLEQEVDSGDHLIFIGRVVAAYLNEGKKVLLNMGRQNGKRIFEEF